MSRRLRTASVAAVLERSYRLLRDQLPSGMLKYIDAKPLPVGGCSKDSDALYGRAASGKAKGYKLFALHEQMRAKNFATMGKVHSEQFKLYRLMKGETPDSKAVLDQQKKVDDVRREMFATHLEMRKQVEAILTPEQRKQLRESGH